MSANDCLVYREINSTQDQVSYNKTFYASRHGLSFGVCDSTHLLNYMNFVLSSYKVFPVPSIKASPSAQTLYGVSM